MEVIQISSVIMFLEKLKKNEPLSIYRGQSNESWSLLPKIGRMYDKMKENYIDWHTMEDDIVQRFKKYARPHMTFTPTSDIEWIVHAQHHGLPTKLLDWSSNPLKALYFAVENVNNTNDGIVWGFEPNGYYDSLTELVKQQSKFNSLVIYFPDYLNTRVSSQDSCFTIFPLPPGRRQMKPIEPKSPHLRKINNLQQFIVPNRFKKYIREELDSLGVSHKTLFPDLDGLATSIRRSFDLP